MPGMEFMMQCYEHELKHPIKNLVSGQLARSLLIQVWRTATTTPIHLCEYSIYYSGCCRDVIA